MRPGLNRVKPAMPASAMKTYSIKAPKSTHTRPATCEEVGCVNYARGWVTRIDERTQLGATQAQYIRAQSGRRFREERTPDGLTAFSFYAEQRCFAEHRASLAREPFYLVRGGDWRGDPRGIGTRQHTRAADWVDDFANNQISLSETIEKG